jgi:hypothetical protein
MSPRDHAAAHTTNEGAVMGAAAPSQTTPDEAIVAGTDIFKFGPSDQLAEDGPGAKDQTNATPAPAAGHPGDATEPEETTPAEPKPTDTKPSTRFKSHEEAERGYKELQGSATRSAQENAELKRRLAEVETKEQAQSAGKLQEEADQATEVYAKERNRAALKEIEALDPDDPDHQDKVAGVWARANTDLIRYSRNPLDKDGKAILGRKDIAAGKPLPQEGTAPEVQPAAVEAQPAAAASPPVSKGANDAAAIERRRAETREYIDAKVKASGIDPEDPLWIGMSLQTPNVDETGRTIPLDDQIQWTIDKHNEYLAQRKAASRATADMPIGGGGHQPRPAASPTAATPIGLGDAITRANERRRL